MTIVKLLELMQVSEKNTAKLAKETLIAMLKSTKTLDLSKQKLTLKDMNILCHILIKYKIPLTCVDLSGTNLREDRIVFVLAAALAQNTTLTHLNLVGSLGGASLILLRAMLSIRLTTLNFSETNDITSLPNYLHNNPYLMTLDLSRNNISIKEMKDLFHAIATHPSLSSLYLDETRIGEEGVIELIDNLIEYKNTTLKCLTFHQNGMRAPGAIALAEYLTLNVNFSRLKISSEELTTDSIKALLQAIETHPSLIDLELSAGFFHPEVLNSLADLLKKNTILQSLTLKNNGITAKKAAALVKAISPHSALKKLSFDGNAIGPEGFSEFMEVLSNNTTLQYLDLRYNPIEEKNVLMFVTVWSKSALRNLDIDFSRCSLAVIKEIAEIIASVTDRPLDMESCKIYLDYSDFGFKESKDILLAAIAEQNLKFQRPKAILLSEQKDGPVLIETLEQKALESRQCTIS